MLKSWPKVHSPDHSLQMEACQNPLVCCPSSVSCVSSLPLRRHVVLRLHSQYCQTVQTNTKLIIQEMMHIKTDFVQRVIIIIIMDISMAHDP